MPNELRSTNPSTQSDNLTAFVLDQQDARIWTCHGPLHSADHQHQEFGDLFPKTQPLPGSLHLEKRRCGQPTCRCARGQLHGPYLVRRWWHEGKQQKAYVRWDQRHKVAAGIAAWQQLHPPTWAMRQHLAQLRDLEQEVIG